MNNEPNPILSAITLAAAPDKVYLVADEQRLVETEHGFAIELTAAESVQLRRELPNLILLAQCLEGKGAMTAPTGPRQVAPTELIDMADDLILLGARWRPAHAETPSLGLWIVSGHFALNSQTTDYDTATRQAYATIVGG